ncbi:addiction module protein [Rhodohalobacter sp. 8-1]|uniref:addiction module protein n=1 Tax=Rhodohalobacter sp. 8-1 TaxID=3131972 RepID=UPI0030EDDCB7
MPIPESIEKNVLNLDKKDRLQLLLKLLESLETTSQSENRIEEWVHEADTRYHVWKAGEMKTVSEDEAFRELRKKP